MHEVWSELSAAMRALRRGAGVSLRAVEQDSGRSRGLLSQMENEKARPNRSVVEYYDTHFDGNGMLLSLFVEARTGHVRGPGGGPSDDSGRAAPADSFEVEHNLVANGQRVARGERLRVGWKLRNTGAEAWRGRTLRRVGAPTGPRILVSPVATAVPDCPPDGVVEVQLDVVAPDEVGTVVGYWQLTVGRNVGAAHLLAVVLIVH